MSLATLLLPSPGSMATKAGTAGDHHTDSRRHDHDHHGSKCKKKPPASPQPSSLASAPRTPPSGARSQRVMVMAASSSSPRKKSPKAPAAGKNSRAQYQQHRGQATKKKATAAASWDWEQVKSLLSCRSVTAAARVHDPAAPSALARLRGSGAGTCGASLCAMRDVVDAASSAASSAAASASASGDRDTAPLNRRRAHRGASSSSAGAGSSHHSSLRGLSGCYECRAINVEPMSRRYPRPRELCACPQCGEVFTKADTLEHHQAIRHAVSELGPEDSGRNIVEIIFKSSWHKRDRPICHIDRILKVHNAPRTVARFEAYRDAVRSRCRAVVAARAAADGNELLRFHSAPARRAYHGQQRPRARLRLG
uniref:C2H2-type domain-containing protein n=1 Tax=Zea mays TaxID=4577 RepID=A0A804ULT6_MAIZE